MPVDPPALRPNALVIGAQKAATTAVIKNLRLLDNVWAPSKELHFFSENWSKGTDWYERELGHLVMDVKPERVAAEWLIEKSPSYMANPFSAARIAEYRSDMKVIACLRNPVDRAYSRYNDIAIDEPGRLKVSFDEIVEIGLKRPDHFLKNGCYAEQLAPYFEHFPRRQIFVMVQERLEARGSKEMAMLYAFLGIPPNDHRPQSFNRNSYRQPMSAEANRALTIFYEEKNEELFQLLGFSIPEWSQT